MLWTLLCAHAAVLALFVVDNCVIVDYVDGVELAFLFAKLAAYAACGAKILCDLARVFGRACNVYTLNIRKDVDNLLWANACAHAAAYADVSVYLSKAVAYGDCAVRASLLAIAKAYASEFARAWAAEELLNCSAGLKTLIIHFGLYCIASAGASYVCNLFDYVLCFYAQYCSDICCCGIGAGNAKICFNAVICCKSCCIIIAACKAAGTAVCAWEALADFYCSFVYGNCHELSCNCKYYSGDKSYNYCKKYRIDKCFHLCTS